MTIKLAYDITLLGNTYGFNDAIIGLSRVTEQLLLELLKRDDLDLTLVDLCSEKLAFSSVSCSLYTKNRLKNSPIRFSSTFKSRLKLEKFYQKLFSNYFSQDFQKLSPYSLESILVRGTNKVLQNSKFLSYDTCRVFDYKNYDIVHSPYCQFPSEQLTGNLARLLMIHDLIPVKAPEFVNSLFTSKFHKLLNSINQSKDWIVCNSEYTRQDFCDYTRMSVDRTFVTYLAADERFHPIEDLSYVTEVCQRYQIPEGNYFLCLLNHLDPRKNLPHLIRCFVRLINEQPNLDVNLVLIGKLQHKRKQFDRLAQLFAQYRNKFIFTGYVPDEDLSALYSGASAFIFPSLYEGFGLPILEAMQCGTPVISSNATCLPEVAGEAAILVNPHDEDALCQAMLNVLLDDNLRQKLSQKGFERAKQFSWFRCADETLQIYKNILGI